MAGTQERGGQRGTLSPSLFPRREGFPAILLKFVLKERIAVSSAYLLSLLTYWNISLSVIISSFIFQ